MKRENVADLPVPVEAIARHIYLIRGQKVMIDKDLADLYQVETFNLNKAVKRNLDRFPDDFMFQLTTEEAEALRFQIGISNVAGRGGRRYRPYAFTEHGVAMLSSVLHSPRAIQMNIAIIRAFIKMRELLATHKNLAGRIEKLESAQRDHAIGIGLVAKDVQTLGRQVMKELKKLKAPRRSKSRIGFIPDN
jgi:hypothetical protein